MERCFMFRWKGGGVGVQMGGLHFYIGGEVPHGGFSKKVNGWGGGPPTTIGNPESTHHLIP